MKKDQNLEAIEKAANSVLAEKVLTVAEKKHELARCVYIYLALEAGASIAEVAKEVKKTYSFVCGESIFFKALVEKGDKDAVAAVRAVQAFLEGMQSASTQLVATAEDAGGGRICTEIDATKASDGQLLIVCLLAWQLGGSMIGQFKSVTELPVPPTDERVVKALAAANALAGDGSESAKTAIFDLWGSSGSIG